ncbi:MAG TPA: ABC transporter substrate-binding protein [Mycobacteriales bacterium]|nr:ABC transporter substrate-binding protein [Mycobacteriales bacterium]
MTGTGNPTAPSTAGANGPGNTAISTAPVRGITKSQIKIGIGLIDVGAAKQFGFNFDIGNERARYQALIDSINRQGGIAGRKIVPYFKSFPATDPTTASQADCLSWTKDDKVFAVLVESQLPTAATVCIIGQGATPLITTQGTEQAYYANGLFWSTQASDNRILHDQADYLAGNGSLKGKTIGILSGDGTDEQAVDNALIPRLSSLGYKVKDVEVVPSDAGGVQRQPIAISNFKAAGVNFIIIASNVVLAGPFVQAANRAGYNPTYALSDFNNEINDQVANFYPASFQGTVGLSTHRFPEYRAGAPFTSTDQACLRVIHPVDSKVLPPTNAAFEEAMGNCAVFDVLVDGLRKAGAMLTQASFLAALSGLSHFGIPATQDGSFSATQHDAVDDEQAVSWQKSCECWKLVNGLHTPIRKIN